MGKPFFCPKDFNMTKYIIAGLVTLWMGSVSFAQYAQWESFLTATRVNDVRGSGEAVWMATDGGLYQYNKADGSVTHWHKTNAGLPSNEVEAIAFDELAQVWIGTYDMEMAYRDGSGNWIPAHFPAGLFNDEQPLLLYCMDFGPDGSLWVGTNQGLARKSGDSWTLTNELNHPGTFLRNIWALEVLPDGSAYVASNLPYRVSAEGDVQLLGNDVSDAPFAYSDAHLLYMPESGIVWHANDIGEVSRRLPGQGWETWQISQDFPGLNSNILSLSKDENGHILVLTERNGAYTLMEEGGWIEVEWVAPYSQCAYADADTRVQALDRQWHIERNGELTTAPFQLHPIQWGISDGFAEADGSMILLHDGAMTHYRDGQWLATDSLFAQGMFMQAYDIAEGANGHRYALAGQRVWQLIDGNWQQVGVGGVNFPIAGLYGASVAPDGSLWVFVYDYGLMHYQGGQWTHFGQSFFAESFIRVMACDNNGLLWMSYIQNNGATVTGIATFDGQQLEIIDNEEIGFEPGYLYDIVTHDNGVYFASYYEGLLHFDGEQWARIEAPGAATGSLARATAVAVSDNNRLAFVIHGEGLYVRDAAGQWQVFDENNSPLPNTEIHRLIWSADDELWVVAAYHDLHVYRGEWVTSSSENVVPSAEITLKLYPNPVAEQLFVDLSQLSFANNEDEMVRLAVWDASGRLVVSKWFRPDAPVADLAVASLPAGAYTLTATTANGLTAACRWIKE